MLGFLLGRGSGSTIGREEALAIALEQAGLSKSDVNDIDIELERRKNGSPRYEVDFEYLGADYDCFIDAVTGQVLAFSGEGRILGGGFQAFAPGQNAPAPAGAPAEAPTEAPAAEQPVQAPGGDAPQPPSEAPAPETATADMITREEALAAALADAGLAETDVYDIGIELERRISSAYYEVDFETASTEYEYDVDAFTGEILRNHTEPNR